MREITINEIQLIEAWAIINCSETLLARYREREYNAKNIDDQITYKHLIHEEEFRLQMAYSIIRALGLSYDADTHELTKREEVEEDA